MDPWINQGRQERETAQAVFSNIKNRSIAVIENKIFLGKMSVKCSAATDLPSIVRGFKIGVTKWCHQQQYPNFAWQR